jgi:hypothetical protein
LKHLELAGKCIEKRTRDQYGDYKSHKNQPKNQTNDKKRKTTIIPKKRRKPKNVHHKEESNV